MTRKSSRTSPLVAGLALLACRAPTDTVAAKQGTLAGGAVAVVAKESIEADTVRRIAISRGISLSEARNAAIFDALFAEGARRSLPAETVANAERSALARRVLEVFRDEAHRAGPPTDDEIRTLSRKSWWTLDCPPLRRVTHAVVLVRRPDEDAAARALADTIAVAVASATNAEKFNALANAVPVPANLSVRVEDLDPVARDGRSVNPEKPPPPGAPTLEYSKVFSEAVFAVAQIDKPSRVVKTEFGYHVLFVTEELPAHAVPLEERRVTLAAEAYTERAAALESAALEHAKSVDHVEVERSALDLASRVNVE